MVLRVLDCDCSPVNAILHALINELIFINTCIVSGFSKLSLGTNRRDHISGKQDQIVLSDVGKKGDSNSVFVLHSLFPPIPGVNYFFAARGGDTLGTGENFIKLQMCALD